MMHGYSGSFPFMGMGMVASIIFIILIFAFIFKDKNEKSAQEILDERYAKGEIDFDEYHEKSKKINEG